MNSFQNMFCTGQQQQHRNGLWVLWNHKCDWRNRSCFWVQQQDVLFGDNYQSLQKSDDWRYEEEMSSVSCLLCITDLAYYLVRTCFKNVRRTLLLWHILLITEMFFFWTNRYVKVRLLPKKYHSYKMKTAIKRGNNPVYNETFTVSIYKMKLLVNFEQHQQLGCYFSIIGNVNSFIIWISFYFYSFCFKYAYIVFIFLFFHFSLSCFSTCINMLSLYIYIYALNDLLSAILCQMDHSAVHCSHWLLH